MSNKNKFLIKKTKKIKLSIVIFVCCIVLSILYFFVFWHANSLSLGLSSKTISEINKNSSLALSNTLKSDILLLESTANNIQTTIENDSNADFSKLIKDMYKNTDLSCQSIIYITDEGKCWTEDGETPNISNYKQFKKIVDLKQNDFDNQKFFSNSEGVYSYVTVKVNDETVGVLFALYSSKELKESYLNSTYGNDGVLFIIDSDGKIVLDPDNETTYDIKFSNFFDLINKSYSNSTPQEEIKNDLSENKSGVKTLFINNIPFIVTFSPVDDINDWYEIYLVPRSVALENMDYLLFTSVLMATLIIFLFALIGYSYSKANITHSENIHELVYKDPLTGYRNFLKFRIDADELLKNQKNTPYCLCYVNMIGFKFVNETFGFNVGDEVLNSISSIINSSMSEDEIFARVSGDRFIILKKRDSNSQNINDFVFSLVDEISKISPLKSSRMRIQAHSGVYIIEPGSNLNLNAMFDRTILALKSINRSDTCIAIYDEGLRTEQLEIKEIERKMETALKNGEFHVYVQPKYKTSDRTLVAGEALIRWHDPEKGVISPIEFIPLFEKNRFVYNIDRYVLEVVCRFLRMRINENKEIVPISLNVSPVEIMIPNFTKSYISIKDKYDIPDGLIELEFTEGVFFENQVLFKEVIIELKAAGFCCSLDDFGSGYSSLNVLKEMPVDVLKLDRMFFKESDNISRDRSLIRSVVAMARSLKIKTVAEGVETLETVEFLKIIGCNMIQGYIYARPMPIDDFEKLMDCEQISDFNDFSDDHDKVSEIIPVDKPYDIPIRNTYDAIYEINVTSNTYHLYKQEDCEIDMDGVDEIGDYVNATLQGPMLSKVHKDDIDNVISVCNPKNLIMYFENNRELTIDYRRLNKNGKYMWIRCRILKAQNMGDQLVLFAYLKNFDKQKQKDEMLSTAQTRLSSAFIGIAGLVYELNLTNGHLALVKSFSKSMQNTIQGNEYDSVCTYIGNYLMHPNYAEAFYKECLLVKLREQFSQSPNKTLYYEYRAKSSRDDTEYQWYSARFSYNPELSDKVLIALQDISKRKQIEENTAVRNNLMTLALKHTYDEILEINLTQNNFGLIKVTDKENHKERYYEGNFEDFLNNNIKSQFLPEDMGFLKEVLSINGLWDMYNDPNVSDFTLNIKKKSNDDTFQWYSLYFIPNHAEIQPSDAIIFIYFKNIQIEKDIHDNASLACKRLNYTTAMFDLVYEINLESKQASVFGGTNIPNGISPSKPIEFNKLAAAIKDTFIQKDDIDYFSTSTSFNSLLKQFKKTSNDFSLFARCKIDGTEWVSIKHIFDSRSNIATVFIQSIDRKGK